jgi:hypothetical protein
MVYDYVCIRRMHRLLDGIDMFVIGYGTDWVVTGRLQ